LSKLTDLTKALNKDENIVRFKEIEQIIDSNKELNDAYKKLQDLQKLMVQKDAKKLDSTVETANYNEQLEVVLGHVLMSEYLDLLEVVNNDLQMIKNIITDEINMELE